MFSQDSFQYAIYIILNLVIICHVLYRESRRREDLERQLDRIECVVLNFPPVDDTDMVLNAAVELISTHFHFFTFLTAAGQSYPQYYKLHVYCCRSVNIYYMVCTLLYIGEGFCNAETENMVDWPETMSGSGPVVMACPENEDRNVTRECIDGIWTEADYSICPGQS